MVSNKAVPENLNLKFKSIYNYGFTNHGCLHCAILKVLYGFNEKKTHKARFFFRNAQNEIFEILKIF